MEKLIELLNEYIKDKYGISGSYELEIDDETGEPTGGIIDSSEDYFEVTSYYITMKIISKRFGFIERLVKNDKINFKSENYTLKSYDGYFDDDVLCIVSQDCNTYEDRIKVEFNKSDSLLMILAIQDNPIEYLCSILKE